MYGVGLHLIGFTLFLTTSSILSRFYLFSFLNITSTLGIRYRGLKWVFPSMQDLFTTDYGICEDITRKKKHVKVTKYDSVRLLCA